MSKVNHGRTVIGEVSSLTAPKHIGSAKRIQRMIERISIERWIAVITPRWFGADSPLGRLGRGTMWISIGVGTSSAFGIVSSIMVARILGTSEFGHLSILRSSVEMMSLFAGMALGMTANRYVSLYRSTQPGKAAQIIGMTTTISWIGAGLGSLLLSIFAEDMAAILSAPSMVFEVRLTAIMLFFTAVSGGYSGILGGLECFKAQGLISSVVAMVGLPLTVGGVLIAGVSGGVLAMSCASALSLILLVRAVKQKAEELKLIPALAWSPEMTRILMAFTLPALLSGAIITPVFWLANVMLVNGPNGYAEMGIFAAANHWRQAVMMIPGIMGAVALPILSNLHGTEDRKAYIEIVWANLKIVSLITIIPAVVLMIISPFILGAYGNAFKAGSGAMGWLLAAGVFFALANVLGQVLASIGKMWLGLCVNTFWAAVFLISAWYLSAYGATGLAAAYSCSYAFHFCLCLVLSWLLVRQTSWKAAVNLHSTHQATS